MRFLIPSAEFCIVNLFMGFLKFILKKILMKKIITLLLLTLISVSLNAQLVPSIWKGTIKGDNPRNVLLDFRKDTLVLLSLSDSAIEETMTYSIKDSDIILRKIEGQSDCDNTTPGKYRFTLRGNSLSIKLVSDPCEDRSSALENTKWQKWKNHPEVHVAESILKQYVGEYEFDAGHHIFISLENGRLQAFGPNNNLPKSTLYAESRSKFFLKVAGVEIDFVRNDQGNVIKFISHEEEDHELKKIK